MNFKSVEGRLIRWREFSPVGKTAVKKIWVLSGTHGDEIEGIWANRYLVNCFSKNYPYKNISICICTEVNPDGVARRKRWNSNDIDLNRNLPTKDWTSEVKNPRYPPGPSALSEPESKALIAAFEFYKPVAILNLHSFWDYQVNVNASEKAKKACLDWAKLISGLCHYPVTEDIGYPTPGCLGTYAGKERDIPSITFEFERGMPKKKVIRNFVPVIIQALQFWDERG